MRGQRRERARVANSDRRRSARVARSEASRVVTGPGRHQGRPETASGAGEVATRELPIAAGVSEAAEVRAGEQSRPVRASAPLSERPARPVGAESEAVAPGVKAGYGVHAPSEAAASPAPQPRRAARDARLGTYANVGALLNRCLQQLGMDGRAVRRVAIVAPGAPAEALLDYPGGLDGLWEACRQVAKAEQSEAAARAGRVPASRAGRRW